MRFPFFILCLFLFPVIANAQQDRQGWHVGAGIGGYFYTTHWYYYRSNANPYHDNYAVHKLQRTTLLLNIEKRGLKTFGSAIQVKDQNCHIALDAGANLLLGFKGQTKADWLAGEPVASGGGLSVGLDAWCKALLLLPATKTLRVAPFISLGPQFMMIHNNGKDLAGTAAETQYHYDEAWNEYLTSLAMGLGVNLEAGNLTLIPQIRFGLTGFGSSSWYPNGDGVTSQGAPAFWSASFTVTKKL